MRYLYLFLLFPIFLSSQNVSDINATVRLSAEVSIVNNSITLGWVDDTGADNYLIYRKTSEDELWGAKLTTIDAGNNTYVDNDITPGIVYEYRILKSIGTQAGYGYITAGIEVSPKHFNGSVLLVVESEALDSIESAMGRYMNILMGEGWKVKTIYVSRDTTALYVKSLITDMYQNNSDLNSVVLIGHVPVPYSGNIVPDGHSPDHRGAWPADTYYADLDGNWTDTSINFTEANRAQNHNVPGDGKFDQSRIPSKTELAVGRIDFFDLPVFTKTEYQLLEAYLEKDIAFRTAKFKPNPRAVIEENFNFGEAFAQSALRSYSTIVHFDSISYGDFDEVFSKSHLLAYGSGGGSYSSAGGIANSAKFADQPVQAVFTMLFGSYFGDFDSRNNFMRSILASGNALSCSWAGRPHWYYHPLGLGSTLGDCARITQNNIGLYVSNSFDRYIHVNLLGDPTLKTFAVSPPSNLVATEDNGHILLEWSASSDDIVGYYLYRREVGNMDYELVANKVIPDRFYIDSCRIANNAYEYLVRACKLEVTPSGSYYNLSGGPTYQITPTTDYSIIADFDISITGDKVSSINLSINADNYTWLFPDGTMSDSSEFCYLLSNFDEFDFTLIAQNQCQSDTLIRSILYSNVDDLSIKNLLHPNPTNGLLKLSNDVNPNAIYIYNQLGILVSSSQVISNQTLDISNLAKGIYTIQVLTGGERFSQKVIKM